MRLLAIEGTIRLFRERHGGHDGYRRQREKGRRGRWDEIDGRPKRTAVVGIIRDG